MANEFRLPDLGEGVHEGQIIRLIVAEGDTIQEDEPLMEVETDKAAVEIPSPFTGRVAKWHVKEDEVVYVGNVMVTIESGAPNDADEASKAKPAIASKATAVAAASTTTTTRESRPAGRRTPASPAVRKLARAKGVDLETIAGSGPGGRVSRTDVEAAASGAAPLARATTSAAPATPPVTHRPPTAPAKVPEGVAGSDNWGEIIRTPLTRPRRTIADTMTRSWTQIPHVTDTDDVDVTLLDELRRTYNTSNPPDGKLTLLPFVITALATALRRHPIFNAEYDAEAGEVIYKQYISINVGVHTDRGLIAPAIRDADMLSVSGAHRAILELAEKARTGKFAVNDLRGGTFTLSNAGAMGGSRYSTPIINPPQVAVLALGRTTWRPWVVGEEIQRRFIMPLSLSFDHRIIDGGDEVAFQQDIRAMLENPGRMLI